MSPDTIVSSLTSLREEIEEAAEMEGKTLYKMKLSAGHFLADVCNSLGLSEEQTKQVIGARYQA
jgi:hypothetical protein